MALTKRQFTKEIICVIGSLNTSDPGNIFDSIAKVKRNVCSEGANVLYNDNITFSFV